MGCNYSLAEILTVVFTGITAYILFRQYRIMQKTENRNALSNHPIVTTGHKNRDSSNIVKQFFVITIPDNSADNLIQVKMFQNNHPVTPPTLHEDEKKGPQPVIPIQGNTKIVLSFDPSIISPSDYTIRFHFERHSNVDVLYSLSYE